jgi:hypothetical protein
MKSCIILQFPWIRFHYFTDIWWKKEGVDNQCKFKELYIASYISQLMKSCHHFQPLSLWNILQTSDERKMKGLVINVCTRNQILPLISVQAWSLENISILVLLTYLWTSDCNHCKGEQWTLSFILLKSRSLASYHNPLYMITIFRHLKSKLIWTKEIER